MVNQIEKLTPLARLDGEKKTRDLTSKVDGSPFTAIFRSAINNVKETDAEFKESQYLLTTGQLDNPAMTMIAASKNQAAVNLLIQLRNKAQDA